MNAYPRRAGPPAAEPVSLDLALTHLRETSDGGANDAYILGLISTARQACEDRTERSLAITPWRLTTDGFRAAGAIELRHPPIISVESIQFKDVSGALQTLHPDDYVVDLASEPGYIVPAPSTAWPATQDAAINTVIVNYTAGYAPSAVPVPLVQWMLLAIGEMYEMRSGSSDKPTVRRGFADALLDPYRLLGV